MRCCGYIFSLFFSALCLLSDLKGLILYSISCCVWPLSLRSPPCWQETIKEERKFVETSNLPRKWWIWWLCPRVGSFGKAYFKARNNDVGPLELSFLLSPARWLLKSVVCIEMLTRKTSLVASQLFQRGSPFPTPDHLHVCGCLPVMKYRGDYKRHKCTSKGPHQKKKTNPKNRHQK